MRGFRMMTLVPVFLASAAILPAATPPPFINYQGVLRDNAGQPLNGSFQIKFKLYESLTGGAHIISDEGQVILATNGLFDVQIGAGTLVDGPSFGTYTTISDVFSDFTNVYLEVEIFNGTSWEILTPRKQLNSAPYALNASSLGGKQPSEFVDTSATAQLKTGPLTVDGTGMGDPNTSAKLAYSGSGIIAEGTSTGGQFFYQAPSNQIVYASLARSDGYGVYAYSFLPSSTGGFFSGGTTGVEGHGGIGGLFDGYVGVSASGTIGVQGIGEPGAGSTGILGSGDTYGGSFSGGAWGVKGTGSGAGGYFNHLLGTGEAYLGYNDVGIDARGTTAGIVATSDSLAGYFAQLGAGFTSQAQLGGNNIGVEGWGGEAGGHFVELGGTGEAYLGYRGIGVKAIGGIGIDAYGPTMAGTFRNNDLPTNSNAFLAVGGVGIITGGHEYGGSFFDNDSSGLAYVGLGDRGIWGKGTFAGGTFSHPDNLTFWADVATPTRKIAGTGAVSFVQNHPYEKDKVIVYAAPEGDEVAVYTRGSARLVNGEARVKLGETFRLVANPNIGLTAQITGRGEDAVMTVSSVSTEELIVKAVSGFSRDAEFDYSVHGLRIGFEATPIVKVKERQAFLPDPQDLEAELGGQPALRTQTALARFEAMEAANEHLVADLTAARALASAIDEGKDVILAEARAHSNEERAALVPPARELMPQVPPAEVDLRSVRPTPPIDPAGPRAPERSDSPVRLTSRQRDTVARMPVVMAPTSGHVEPGDVLVLDTIEPGSVRAGDAAQDPRVAGCALAPELEWPEAPGKAAVGTTGVVICRADAGHGAIQVGDLLTTSSTPGHAMLARDPVAGTILGKAFEPLAEGTGLIRVLITLR